MQMDFTRGSIGKKLLVFAAPIMLAMLLQTAYNLIDTIFVGMLGAYELAAISLAFPIVFIFIAIASGLGIGANALISQAIGRKKIHEANNIAEHSLFLGVISGVIIAVFGILFGEPLFVFMGADSTVLPLTMQYAIPIFIGIIFMFMWYMSDSILKAQGNSKAPLKSLGVSLAINTVLDPIMIFGLFGFPALGISGATIATVISRIIATGINFAYIYSPKSVISLALKEFKPYPTCIKEILAIGLPASASQTLSAAGFILLTSIVGSFGSFALAAFGVGMRLNTLVILPLIGLENAVLSFVGQNIGAKNFERAKKAAIVGTRIAFIITIALTMILLLFPEQIFRVFTQDIIVIGIGKGYLGIVPFAFLFYGLYFIFVGAFQGAGKTSLALATNIVYWITAVILAFFLSQSIGIRGIWLAIVIAAAIEMVVVTIIFWSGIWMKNTEKTTG